MGSGDTPVAKEPFVPSVLFFKRLIAATLAFIILTLTVLSIVTGVKLRRTRDRLGEYVAAEEARLAEEEAERLRNAIPPEKEKPANERDAMDILSEQRIVAHALGEVDGIAGLNCLEGFRENYDAGVRVFEADFRMTSDGYVVLRHDWRRGWQPNISEKQIPTLEQFRDTPINRKYTPLSFGDLLLLMEQYEDICIVTDSKFVDAEVVTAQLEAMLNEARRLGRSYLLDRMIVQVYSQLHYKVVDNLHHFPHYIYTLYQDGFTGTEEGLRERLEFVRERGIEGLTLEESVWRPEWMELAEEAGVKVFVYTVNDAARAKELLEGGVSAIYTDRIKPAELEE